MVWYLTVSPISGKIGGQRVIVPAVKVKAGNREETTPTYNSGGRFPIWKTSFNFSVEEDSTQNIEIECWNYQVPEFAQNGPELLGKA
jgi:hypothetical protein